MRSKEIRGKGEAIEGSKSFVFGRLWFFGKAPKEDKMRRMVVPILFLVSFFAVPCAYPDEVFKVWAASDSQSSPLDTDIYVSAGERLVISVPSNETWSAGGNRPHSRQSNAGGLTGLGPNSGYYWGNYTYG